MQVRYDELTAALNRRLPAERLEVLGRATAFIRRLRQVSASGFVWSVVLLVSSCMRRSQRKLNWSCPTRMGDSETRFIRCKSGSGSMVKVESR